MGPPAATIDLYRDGATETVDLAIDAWGTPVLFVSNRPIAARDVEAQLTGPGDELFHVTHVRRWPEALAALDAQDFAAVLLDAEGMAIDVSRASALLRKVARWIPTFTLQADLAAAADATRVIRIDDVDRRDLLRRIRARQQKQSGSSSPTLVAMTPEPPAKTAVCAVDTALEQLLEGRRPAGLEVHFAPVGAGPGRAPVALAAQLRCSSSGVGALPPADFQRALVAAHGGFEVWRWVLDEACRRIRRQEVEKVVLPLSLGQADHESVVRAVCDSLADRDLRPEVLELALGEPDVMAAPDLAATWTSEFKLIGVSVCLTHVGRDRSSFSTLAHLRPSRLEVDAGLVARVHSCRDARDAVAAIVAVARALDAVPSAEGVELQLQAEALDQLGVRVMRGAWLDEPVTPR